MAELLDEIHPGEILLEDFMKPLGISARQLAADIDVSPSRISELVHGTRPVTADTALRLGLFFQMEPRFWLNLQTEYDMRIAARTLQEKIAPRIRVFHQAAA
jgi:addiction module HigA family antidote